MGRHRDRRHGLDVGRLTTGGTGRAPGRDKPVPYAGGVRSARRGGAIASEGRAPAHIGTGTA